MTFNPNGYFLKRLGNFPMNRQSSNYQFKEKKTTCGRQPGSNLKLLGHKSSKDHAEIEFEDGRMFIRDLNSSVGTFIDGKKLKGTKVELFQNMIIGFGYNHLLAEHMEAQKSSIYKVQVPDVVDLSSDSDYDSENAVEIIEREEEEEGNENQPNNHDEIERCERISVSTLRIEEDEEKNQEKENIVKNDNFHQKTPNNLNTPETHENIDQNIQKSSSDQIIINEPPSISLPTVFDDNMDFVLNAFEDLAKNYKNFRANHENLTKNDEQQPEIIEKQTENVTEETPKTQKPAEKSLKLIVPPNVNQNLLNFQKSPIIQLQPSSSGLTTQKSVDKSSTLPSQNCENLVELAKNLQGDKGIRTVAQNTIYDFSDSSNASISSLGKFIGNKMRKLDESAKVCSVITAGNVFDDEESCDVENNQSKKEKIQNVEKHIKNVERIIDELEASDEETNKSIDETLKQSDKTFKSVSKTLEIGEKTFEDIEKTLKKNYETSENNNKTLEIIDQTSKNNEATSKNTEKTLENIHETSASAPISNTQPVSKKIAFPSIRVNIVPKSTPNSNIASRTIKRFKELFTSNKKESPKAINPLNPSENQDDGSGSSHYMSLSPEDERRDSGDESLVEEMPLMQRRKFPTRRESILKIKRRRGSAWSRNPGMVKKTPQNPKKPKVNDAIPGLGNRTSPQTSPSTAVKTTKKFPELNEKSNETEEVENPTPQGPQKRAAIKRRRKSVFEKQNELISDNDTIKEKVAKIRHWNQNTIKVIDPPLTMPGTVPGKRRGRKPKESP